jgi:hypothetical protein
MNTALLGFIPVLPSADITRDILWYKEKIGFSTYFADNRYAVLYRENLTLHLQWHAGTESDPLPEGAVIRVPVKNINPLFEECIQRGTITRDAFRLDTAWGTNEFGFYDLNKNCIFIMEDIK